MWFTSDNAGPAHPAMLESMTRANDGYAASYGGDGISARVTALVREAFEAPEAVVHLASTGTAANALALACLCPPWATVYCHEEAHIEVDECGAPEFYTGGAKLTLLPGDHAKIDPQALEAKLETAAHVGVHNVQRGAVSITQANELGAVYGLDEVAALTALARRWDLPAHMDGARFANAVARLGCSPAELSWKAGIDVLGLGATKNGALGVEAVIFFDPEKAWEFELRRKRGGHLHSKMRYVAAQMEAYLSDGLWLDLARRANAAADRLAAGLAASGVAEIMHPVDANIIFAALPRRLHDRLATRGARYFYWPNDPAPAGPADARHGCRLVCNWATRDEDIDAFVAALRD